MANANLNQFMKNLVAAANKQEQRSTAKDSLKKQVLKVKRIAGSKRLKKDELKQELRELEKRLNRIDGIKKRFPDHDIITEEQDIESQGSDWQWVIDPLDGTVNYANNIPQV